MLRLPLPRYSGYRERIGVRGSSTCKRFGEWDTPSPQPSPGHTVEYDGGEGVGEITIPSPDAKQMTKHQLPTRGDSSLCLTSVLSVSSVAKSALLRVFLCAFAPSWLPIL